VQQRPLGKTGLSVSPLGFGAFKIGRNEKVKYPQPYDLPGDDAVERLLNGVLDLGVTLIDTALAYGLSEERVGRCLAGRRKEFVLSTKVGEVFENGQSRYDFGEAEVRRSVARSLQRLQTDVLDLVLIHTPADDVPVLTDTDVVATLLSLKQAGQVRAVGLSGKSVEAEQMALDWADVLMVEYCYGDTAHLPVIEEAGRRGVGVLVKKGLASGQLPPEEAIPFVIQTSGVSSLVVGGLSLEHIAANVRLVENTDH